MSNRVLERMMAILTTMEANPQGISARELAEIIGYPEGLILEDLNNISLNTDLGSYFTLYSDADDADESGDESADCIIRDPNIKWYLLMGDDPYPTLSLSLREAMALMWIFTVFPPPEHLDDLRNNLLRNLLSVEEAAVAKEMAENLYAQGGVTLEEKEYLDELREALLNENKVIIKYYAKNWDKTVHWKIWPLGLVFHTGNGMWYLVARYEDTVEITKEITEEVVEEIVVCHFDRIKKVRVLEDKFHYPEDFSLRSYLGRRWGMDFSKPEVVRVRFYNEANVIEKVLREFRSRGLPAPEQMDDGSLEYHGQIHGIHNFSKWVLSLGSSAEVLEPRWLREEMIRIARYWYELL